jgi:hypothetical protein
MTDASTPRLAMRLLLGHCRWASATRFVRQAVRARVDRGRRALAPADLRRDMEAPRMRWTAT